MTLLLSSLWDEIFYNFLIFDEALRHVGLSNFLPVIYQQNPFHRIVKPLQIFGSEVLLEKNKLQYVRVCRDLSRVRSQSR